MYNNIVHMLSLLTNESKGGVDKEAVGRVLKFHQVGASLILVCLDV